MLVTGCASVKVYRTDTGTVYPPTKPDSVLVFFAAADVKRPFEVIGDIMAEGSSSGGVNDAWLVSKSQEKAAELGANAIIVTKLMGATATSAMPLGSSQWEERIQVIRFTDSSAPVPPKPEH